MRLSNLILNIFLLLLINSINKIETKYHTHNFMLKKTKIINKASITKYPTSF